MPNRSDTFTSLQQQETGHLQSRTDRCPARRIRAECVTHWADDVIGPVAGAVSEQRRQALLSEYPDFHDRLARIYNLLLTIAERERLSPDHISDYRDEEDQDL